MILFSEWNKLALGENFLCFRTGDAVLLEALGDVALVPFKGEVL